MQYLYNIKTHINAQYFFKNKIFISLWKVTLFFYSSQMFLKKHYVNYHSKLFGYK
jgi:hypothetical protein